jgi:hypothetical protein
MEQERIEDAEDGGVGAHGNGERSDSRGGEGGRGNQRSKSTGDIFQDNAHARKGLRASMYPGLWSVNSVQRTDR